MNLMIREDIEQKVLGALLLKPSNLLGSEIKLSVEDFTSRLHKIIFGCIVHLINNGVAKITSNDVEDFLRPYKEQYEYYTVNQGTGVIEKSKESAEPTNFLYYYRTLKKITLINQLIMQGFDVSNFFSPEEIDISKSRKIVERFENATVEEIIAYYDKMLLVARRSFISNKERVSIQAGEGVRQLVEKFKASPELGMPLSSLKLNTAFRGRRLGKLYIYSATQGGGKSRIAMGDAGRLAALKTYNTVTGQWEINEHPQPTLYISTEMEVEELQTMILAYISGINENTILDGSYSCEELPIIEEAIKVLENSPLYFEYMSSFNIADIEEEIKTYKQQYDIQALFFDYIHINMKSSTEISSKMGMRDMREDSILLMFTERLKIMANEYSIHIHTSTQVSSDWETKETPNQNLIRGAKSIADKGDIGAILLPPNKQEEAIIEGIKEKYEYTPNLVLHIYKTRIGRFPKNTKIFVYFDYGTCRMYDCFATDKTNKLIPIDDTIIQ